MVSGESIWKGNRATAKSPLLSVCSPEGLQPRCLLPTTPWEMEELRRSASWQGFVAPRHHDLCVCPCACGGFPWPRQALRFSLYGLHTGGQHKGFWLCAGCWLCLWVFVPEHPWALDIAFKNIACGAQKIWRGATESFGQSPSCLNFPCSRTVRRSTYGRESRNIQPTAVPLHCRVENVYFGLVGNKGTLFFSRWDKICQNSCGIEQNVFLDSKWNISFSFRLFMIKLNIF